MNLPRLLALLCLACGLVLTGCQSTTKYGEISVTLVDIKPVGATLFESSAVLTLRFINENVVPFGISGSSHKVYLNGSYVGKAVSDQPLGLQPQSTATRDVTLHLENTALLKQFLGLNRNSTITYRLETTVFILDGEDKVQLKSQTTGSVDLQSITDRVQ